MPKIKAGMARRSYHTSFLLILPLVVQHNENCDLMSRLTYRAEPLVSTTSSTADIKNMPVLSDNN